MFSTCASSAPAGLLGSGHEWGGARTHVDVARLDPPGCTQRQRALGMFSSSRTVARIVIVGE